MEAAFLPSYLALTSTELRQRAERAVATLADCRACPRDCGVNRLEDKWAACKTGRYAVVSSYFPHFGEEDCLRGWNGSGTIFFSHCNLRCVFCQNYDISQAIKPPSLAGRNAAASFGEPRQSGAERRDSGPSSSVGSEGTASSGAPPWEITRMMLRLQEQGCHNINFVTPEHVAPQVVEAVAEAARAGLRLPIVYNTSAYDSLESLELLDGIVDIYMPDFKYWSAERSKAHMQAENYPEAARAAIKAMYGQVGPLQIDEEGLARRGLLVRHLVMPGCLDETRAILQWIAREIGPETYVNLMDQYYPAGKVSADRFPELNRRLRPAEYLEALAMAADLGLRRLDVRRPHPRLRRYVMVGSI